MSARSPVRPITDISDTSARGLTAPTEASAAAAAAAPVVPPPPAAAERRRYDRSIIEGPLAPAVWKLAWPTMLTNVIGGLQGMIDHALVGNLVGYKANAAIGVSWQIMLVVIVFISSVFTGMSVLVSRFVGVGNDRGVRAVQVVARRLGRVLPARPRAWTRLEDHQVVVPFRFADGHSGDRDEHRRRVDAVVHRIAGAERRVAGGVRRLVYGAVLADHVDVCGADGRRGRRRGAEPRRGKWRWLSRRRSRRGAHRVRECGLRGILLPVLPAPTARDIRTAPARSRRGRRAAAAGAERVRTADCRGTHIHGWPAGNGRHQGTIVHLDRLADC